MTATQLLVEMQGLTFVLSYRVMQWQGGDTTVQRDEGFACPIDQHPVDVAQDFAWQTWETRNKASLVSGRQGVFTVPFCKPTEVCRVRRKPKVSLTGLMDR